MTWWQRLLRRKPECSVAFQLYNKMATRGAEVRVRQGKAYYIALEHVEGTIWQPAGQEVGPYGSPEDAEIAVVGSRWFNDGE